MSRGVFLGWENHEEGFALLGGQGKKGSLVRGDQWELWGLTQCGGGEEHG